MSDRDAQDRLDLAEQDVDEQALKLSGLLEQYTQQIADDPTNKDAMSGIQGQIDSTEQDLTTATTRLNEALEGAGQHLDDTQGLRDALKARVDEMRSSG